MAERGNVMEEDRKKLSSKQVAKLYGINESTLRSWRYRRAYDKRYPRYHKLFTGSVFYLRSEVETDLANMEVDADAITANY